MRKASDQNQYQSVSPSPRGLTDPITRLSPRFFGKDITNRDHLSQEAKHKNISSKSVKLIQDTVKNSSPHKSKYLKYQPFNPYAKSSNQTSQNWQNNPKTLKMTSTLKHL